MIRKDKELIRYCCEDLSRIENYEAATKDENEVWDCHHRGEILPCGIFSKKDLKTFGLYWERPASELIFLRHAEHRRLHNLNLSEETRVKISEASRGNKYRLGKPHSEETRRKISEAMLGVPKSDETKRKISEARRGVPKSAEHRRKMSEARKGRHWFNNGVETVFRKECPEGFVKGKL